MGGQALAMATGGIICKSELVERIILPFSVKLNNESKKVNVKRSPIKNVSLKRFNVNSIMSFSVNLNNKIKKINVKRSPIKNVSLKRI